MRRLSPKKAAAVRVYLVRRRAYLEVNPNCAIGGEQATEVHHMQGRGSLLLDESKWLPLCRDHHRQVTENPRWAIAEGWSLPRVGAA